MLVFFFGRKELRAIKIFWKPTILSEWRSLFWREKKKWMKKKEIKKNTKYCKF